jgi:hypothetical protein
MSKEEPAWKAELEARVADLFRVQDGKLPDWTRMVRTADALGSLIGGLVEPHIRAAEQRGFQAGVNKTGDSVGKLRERLKTAREELRQAQCQRCKGSGIDPEFSHPAEGPSYYSMGEPEALEPCVACQFPDKP